MSGTRLAAATAPAVAATGPAPRPLWPVLTALLAERLPRAAVLVPDAEALHEVGGFARRVLAGRRVVTVPGWDTQLYDQADPDPRLIAERAMAAAAVAAGAWDLLVVDAAARWLPLGRYPDPVTLELGTGGELDPARLIAWGYRRVGEVSAPGEYTERGEILDVWSPLEPYPLRIDRFDTVIETLRRFDPVSQLSARPVERYTLGIAAVDAGLTMAAVDMAGVVERRAARTRADPAQVARVIDAIAAGRPCPGRALWWLRSRPAVALPEHWDLIVSPGNIAAGDAQRRQVQADERSALAAEGWPLPHVDPPPPAVAAGATIDGAAGPADLAIVGLAAAARGDASAQLAAAVRPALAEGDRVLVTMQDVDLPVAERALREAGLAEDPRVLLVTHRIRGHWRIPALGLRLVDAVPMLRRRLRQRRAAVARTLDLGDLKPGDLVVHEDYGIGRFAGLERIDLDGYPLDVVRLRYRDDDTVFVPVTRLNLVEPFRGGGEDEPRLDKLGAGAWRDRRARAREEMVRFAAELLRLYAQRERAERPPLDPPGEVSVLLENNFPWDETPDQLRALDEIEADLQRSVPMDRLLIGDVGYGKTEIALRAAARFVEQGMQVALLVPTTVLAVQHGRTFHERLKQAPVRIGVLSRMTGSAELRQTLAGLRGGSIDIVIGTHRLLQPDVAFARLGLVVIDEEHRFGVQHKEALKALRGDVDTLSMSATPIPRTLQLHMGGVRPMSMITTPPPNRLGVETRVMPYDDDTVREALLRERARGGQTFVLHNRIDELESIGQDLQRLIGDLRIGVVHGRLRPQAVEDVLLDFMEHRIDVLLATTIIESGLDFPRANTLIVRDARHYGLAELYQLRGRVGRSERRAFAYLLVPPEGVVGDRAEARLDVLRSFSNLGAGFHIAMRDLEIRGAGEVLGKKQAGHMRSLGLNMMMRLLDEAIATAHGDTHHDVAEPEIQADLPLVLTPEWIADPEERLRAYQRLSLCETVEAVDATVAELGDRFGPPHDDDEPFLKVVRFKPLLRSLHARAFRLQGEGATLFLAPTTPVEPARLLAWMAGRSDVTLRPDRLRLTLPPHDPARLDALGPLLAEMVAVLAGGAA